MEIKLTLFAGAKVVSSIGFDVTGPGDCRLSTGFIVFVSCPIVGDDFPVGDIVGDCDGIRGYQIEICRKSSLVLFCLVTIDHESESNKSDK